MVEPAVAHRGAISGVHLKFAVLLALLVSVALAEIAFGPVRLTLGDIARAMTGNADPMPTAIITQIRTPRMVLGLGIGLSLAMCGAVLQGLLRNPLADPGLIGISGGASAAVVVVIVLGDLFIGDIPPPVRPYVLPIAAFLGALLVTGLILGLSQKNGEMSVGRLILVGVAINSIAGAGIGFLTYISDDTQLRDLTFWSMGSLAKSGWLAVLISVAAMLAATLYLYKFTRALDLFQLGERAAFHSGLDVMKIKFTVCTICAVAVGAGVSIAGPIGFIGLVAPHIARMLVGASHRVLLPASALVGGALLLGADLIVRTVAPPQELPIGLATSLIGGPFFLFLLLRERKI
ncbi:iron ABC transporter permease [Amylibacter sp. IMCC11727]|uniref:FecCD family ABC transporter permease n=1 Tax=Amylibacter sp. IMCC11727 TaxID=3039851 RepID=UPI00244DD455|nr:iron ABC transporter permease [Amylibacter sp. IMCC11727]WGI23563.1 iron ABC transporter permease [Amylibacter sp. IMCC11727]